MKDEEIIDKLTKIKGIGLWTAHMFLMFGLKREDVFPYTDYGIRKNIALLINKDLPLSFSKTKEIGKRWYPDRSYASLLIWKVKDYK